MATFVIREYQNRDLAGCCRVFSTNAGRYFAAHESTEFEDDLRAREKLPVAKRWPYFVLETNGVIRACGGYVIDTMGEAILLWGMVDRAAHRQGLGTALLKYRLKYIGHKCTKVKIDTTPQSFEFYKKAGFTQTGLVIDGYEAGMDKVYAELLLD